MTIIRFRRDTAADWTAANPVLDDGEPAIDKTSGVLKIGDGVTHWLDLGPAVGGQANPTYLDHGNQSGAVSYASSIETHTLTMIGDTDVTLTGGTDGRTVQVFATGNYILTVNGLPIPTQRAIAIMVRGVWQIYVISGSADSTAPAAGVLAVTWPDNGSATLTVSGASDFGVGLHAAPYSFTQDGGTTWTAWQTSPAYSGYTGFPATTPVTFQHRTRDAVGNISLGVAVSTTVPVYKTWQIVAEDTFASGATITGRSTTTGALPWTVANGNAASITGGYAYWDATSSSQQYVAHASASRSRVTVDYDCSTHTIAGARASVAAGFETTSAWNNQISVSIGTVTNGNTADLQFSDNAAGTWTMTLRAGVTNGTFPAIGTLVIDVDFVAMVGTVSVQGTIVADIAGTVNTLNSFGGLMFNNNSTSKCLNFKVEKYA